MQSAVRILVILAFALVVGCAHKTGDTATAPAPEGATTTEAAPAATSAPAAETAAPAPAPEAAPAAAAPAEPPAPTPAPEAAPEPPKPECTAAADCVSKGKPAKGMQWACTGNKCLEEKATKAKGKTTKKKK